jgi:hypothetical protein
LGSAGIFARPSRHLAGVFNTGEGEITAAFRHDAEKNGLEARAPQCRFETLKN